MASNAYLHGISRSFISRLRFTYCENIHEEHGDIKKFVDVAFLLPKEFCPQIEKLRAAVTPEEYIARKEALPVWFPGGVFFGRHTKEERVIGNALICIDVDGKQNPGLSVATMKERAGNSPFVFFAAESCGGKGIYMLVPLPDDYCEEIRFKGYFAALSEYWAASGVVVDPSCCNFNRARFLSFDDAPVFNDKALVWTECKMVNQDCCVPSPSSFAPAADSLQYDRVEAIVTQCESMGVDLAPRRCDWFGLAASLANGFGEDGREFFLRLSKVWEDVTGQAQKDDPNETFDRALESGKAPIGHFFKMAKSYGILADGGISVSRERF